MKVRSAMAAVGIVLSALAATLAQPAYARGLTPQDVLRMNVLSDAFFAPGSDAVTLSIQRQWQEGTVFNSRPTATRNDLWLERHGKPIDLTQGRKDGASFWFPAWSPNGRFLAMLSARGGSQQSVCVWLWDRNSQKLAPLNGVTVDSLVQPLWISDEELVLITPGVTPGAFYLADAPRLSQEFYRKAWSGREPSAGVLESGLPVAMEQRPPQKLLIYNVRNKRRTDIFAAVFNPTVPVSLSPDRKLLAGLVMTALPPLNPQRLIRRFDNRKYQVRLFNKHGVLAYPGLENVKTVVPTSLRWSADGSQLFFVGDLDENADIGGPGEWPEPKTLFRLNLASGKVEAVSLGGLQPVEKHFYADLSDLKFSVAGQGALLLQAYQTKGKAVRSDSLIHVAGYGRTEAYKMNYADDTHLRKDWWLLPERGAPRNLTAQLPVPPAELFLESDGRSALGLVGGKLRRIALQEPFAVSDVASATSLQISSILWLGADNHRAGDATHHLMTVVPDAVGEMVVQAGDGQRSGLFYLNFQSGKVQPIHPPDPAAALLALSDDRQSVLFRLDSERGTFVWKQSIAADSPRPPLLQLNTFLQDINEAPSQALEVLRYEREAPAARLWLPTDYRRGQKYPMAVWPTVRPGGAADSRNRINSDTYLNYQLLAARGYAVLEVNTVRQVPFGQVNEVAARSLNAVMPAIDKAIELGVADPERLAVWGASNAGYLTLDLITKTDRFKAAICLVGPSNHIDAYLQLRVTERYGDYPQENLFQLAQLEAGAWSLGASPWKDPQIYMRSSPVFAVDKVATPVLLMYGDLDDHPIQNGEEFFIGLYRQGKRARFVRYFGEGHNIFSPANFIDMWRNIYRWLEENNCPPNAAERDGTN